MSTPPRLDVDAVLDHAKIIVCCGSGGVGKTTTAAALALRAAERGRRTVVLTIDPARRLAQSMGLTELDNTPRVVEGIDTSKGGSLDAMMLDMKRTFDDIVVAHAEPGKAQAILDNPFYQALSSSFAGTLAGARLSGMFGQVGLDAPQPVVDALLAEVAEHAERVDLEERGRDALAALERPSYELPRMTDAVALDSLYEMAELLCQQGMA